MKRLGWLLLIAAPMLAQVPVPQLGLTGNIGCQGFPCVNSGTLIMATDANHTMTVQETSAFYLKVTSSVSLTATRNLIAPAGRFPFTIENATTGGQSIQVIGASGTGITIPNGQTVSVWNDGTNFVQIGLGQTYPASGIANSTGSSWGTSYGSGNQIPAADVNLSTYAQLASPSLTGVPTAPTATPGTVSTQIATTAFVSAQFPTVYECVFTTQSIAPASSINCTGSGSGTANSVAIATWQGNPTVLTTVAPLILDTYMSSSGAPAVSIYNPTSTTITFTATINLQVVYQ